MALAIVTACSSAAHHRPTKGAGGLVNAGPGATIPGAASETTTTSAGAAASGGGPARAGGGVSGTGTGPIATNAGSGTPSAAAAAATSQGVTATSISIGISIYTNTNKSISAVGLKGVDRGNEHGMAQAAVDYINANGGLAGRKVVPIFHTTDATSNNTASQNAQEACTDLTEDHKVFAAWTTVPGSVGPLAPCLASHNTMLISETLQDFLDQTDFNALGGYVYAPMVNGSRWHVFIDLLASQGYFDKGSKIGILRWDTADQKRVADNVVAPALADHGLKATDDIALSPIGSVQEISGLSAQTNNAVLRFRQDGVNHVIFLTEQVVPFVFLPAAEAQGFRPRYGFTSLVLPTVMAANAPAHQLDRSVGAGWSPLGDVQAPQDPGGRPSATLCDNIMAKAGLTPFPSRAAEGQAIADCDAMFFLKAVLDHPGALTANGFRTAAETGRIAFASPNTFSTQLGPSRHDWVSSVRAVAYNSSCSCFTYVGNTVTAP